LKCTVRHISCPSCGGTLASVEGRRTGRCPSCGGMNLVEIENHVPKYYIEPELDLKAAKLAARRRLRYDKLAPDILKKARFYDAGLYYIPLYQMSAQRVGKLVTREIKRQYDVSREEERANVLLRDIHHQAPAVRLGEWGVENIDLGKLRQIKPVKPFDRSKLEKDAHVFDSTIPPESAGIGRAAVSDIAGDDTRLLRKRLSMVYCPVWLVKYTYRNRLYKLVIDAVTGNVLYGRAPARDAERIPVMLAALAFLTLPIARYARLFLVGDLNETARGVIFLSVPVGIITLLGVFFLAFAWNQFRYSGELVWRGDEPSVERVNKPPETALEKLARGIVSAIDYTFSEVTAERSNRWYGQWSIFQ